jgi:uncharacterized surface protein with fasciclin (FAS1) repeats
MRPTRLLTSLTLGIAAAVTGSLALAPAASASTTHHPKPLGTKSLASVLLADKSGFDHKGSDYDVLTAAVLAVLKAKPTSKVSVLTDGKVALTAFLPNDRAFATLVKEITGKQPASEKATFEAVAGLGIPTVETVLLYHVVPGATITAKAALGSDGAKLTTAQGGTFTVDVDGCRHHATTVTLQDADTNDRDPKVIRFDINKGNKQIAHGIDRVLRPIDLP